MAPSMSLTHIFSQSKFTRYSTQMTSYQKKNMKPAFIYLFLWMDGEREMWYRCRKKYFFIEWDLNKISTNTPQSDSRTWMCKCTFYIFFILFSFLIHPTIRLYLITRNRLIKIAPLSCAHSLYKYFSSFLISHIQWVRHNGYYKSILKNNWKSAWVRVR